MGWDASVAILLGARVPLAKVKEEKEVTKYDVDTGKPYTRKEVSFSLVLGQKPITEQAIEHLQDHGRLHVETGPLRAKAAATSPAILAVEVARMSCGYDKQPIQVQASATQLEDARQLLDAWDVAAEPTFFLVNTSA
jgi:hypothetical protein